MTETLSGATPGERVAEAAASGIGKAKQQTGAWSERVAGKADSARQPIADKLHDAANAIRGNAERLYDRQGISEGVSDVAQATADKIESSATYLESHDAQQMMQDVGAVVRRYPTQSLLIAGALGFLCGRALRGH